MMVPGPSDVRTVRIDDLRVGDLLAEGGEGRVFTLPLQPHLVLKSYLRPASRSFLEDLVTWPTAIRRSDLAGRADLAGRVCAAAAWPAAVAVDGAGSAAGLLMPRAPRRFALRHRDGTTRLASLSYLTADPAHRAMAYGLSLPPEVSPERLGLVYALARLLQAFELGPPSVGHGDLSTKNVLWSLQRGPEVFVIDCDNCERFGPQGEPLGGAGRRRAMTPNWDDPAVAGGTNPTLASDRYSLALIFLRVVGAANFPIQARQRQDGAITVDFAMSPGPVAKALSDPGALIWELCAGGLGVACPDARPPASAWVAALEGLLDAVGASEVMRSVWAVQGGGRSEPQPSYRRVAGDVSIRPVLGPPRPSPRWTIIGADTPAMLPWHRPTAVGTQPGSPVPVVAAVGPANPLLPEVLAFLRRCVHWWIGLHRHTAHALMSAGRRVEGFQSLVLCAAVDLLVAIVGLFSVAMVVAPVMGI
jgi:hypothetical protein